MENNIRVSLNKEQKALLSKTLGVAVDSDLFDPRYDYVFKRIFTADSEKSKIALIDFLNAVLSFSGDEKIVDLTVINAEIPVNEKEQKKSVFDIRVIFKNGEQALVEMELRPKDDFKKRSQFLISKAYSSQRITGLHYRDLKRCYLVCITNFTLFADSAAYSRNFMYRDIRGIPLTDDLTIVFLELSKLETLLTKPVEALSNIEMWAIFLRYASDKGKRNMLHQILNRERGIKMAAQVLELISRDEQERIIYESQLLYEADQEAEWRYRERTAIEKGRERGREEGRKEGRKEGREEGRKEGRKEGREEGRKEGREEGRVKGREEGIEEGIEKGKLTVAKNLILKNFPLDVIADITGVSVETLKTL